MLTTTTPGGLLHKGLWQLKPVASTTTADCTSPPPPQRSYRNFPLQTELSRSVFHWVTAVHATMSWPGSCLCAHSWPLPCCSSQYTPWCMSLQSSVCTPLALDTTAASPGLLLLDTEASLGSPTVLVDPIALMVKDHPAVMDSNFLSPWDNQPQSRSHYVPAHPVPWATRLRAAVSFSPKFCLHIFFQHRCIECQDFWHHQPQGVSLLIDAKL